MASKKLEDREYRFPSACDRVAALRAWCKSADRIASKAILEYIDRRGEAYSRGLRDGVPLDLSVNKIGKLLRAMEAEGLLVGETRSPPFEDQAGGGMQRRYYRRA